MSITVVLAVTMGLVWLLALATAQVRVVDAARETARAVARDEAAGTAVALGRRVAPPGSTLTLGEEADGLVRVRVVAEVKGPGGLFGFMPGVEVEAEAVTAGEGP